MLIAPPPYRRPPCAICKSAPRRPGCPTCAACDEAARQARYARLDQVFLETQRWRPSTTPPVLPAPDPNAPPAKLCPRCGANRGFVAHVDGWLCAACGQLA
jgi:hypothetical protein